MNAKLCICRGRPPEALISAYASRARKAIAAGLSSGIPAPSYKDLRITVTLVRALSEGRTKGPFQAKYARLDHHLPECPCSPRYAAPATAT